MTLGNMRRNGVRGLFVSCQNCVHCAKVNVDAWPDAVLLCSARLCGAARSASSAQWSYRIGANGRRPANTDLALERTRAHDLWTLPVTRLEALLPSAAESDCVPRWARAVAEAQRPC